MSWRNETKIGYRQITLAPDTTGTTAALIGWLEGQPALGKTTWLLAHAEDGVIWGKLVDGRLKLSSQLAESLPQLRSETLLEARLFGELAEVHLWRVDNGWCACRVEDQMGTGDAFDEAHRLWGVRIDLAKAQQLWDKQSNGTKAGFTLVVEPGAGIAQAVPIEIAAAAFARPGTDFDQYSPLVLTCRHYLAYDAMTGEAKIVANRLVNLQVEPFADFKKRWNS